MTHYRGQSHPRTLMSGLSGPRSSIVTMGFGLTGAKELEEPPRAGNVSWPDGLVAYLCMRMALVAMGAIKGADAQAGQSDAGDDGGVYGRHSVGRAPAACARHRESTRR